MRNDWNGSGSGPAMAFDTGVNGKFLLAEIQQKFIHTHIINPLIHTTSVYAVCSLYCLFLSLNGLIYWLTNCNGKLAAPV